MRIDQKKSPAVGLFLSSLSLLLLCEEVGVFSPPPPPLTDPNGDGKETDRRLSVIDEEGVDPPLGVEIERDEEYEVEAPGFRINGDL